MCFRKIDLENWARKPYFEQYYSQCTCTYSVTANVDITDLLPVLSKNQLKLYGAFLYMVSKIINRHEEFRICFDENKVLGVWDFMHPDYTIFHDDDKTFSAIFSLYSEDFETFYQNFSSDLAQNQNEKGFSPQADKPQNTFCVSCVPWISFTGFNLNIYNDGRYLLPIITSGKYFAQGEQILLPVAFQAHHAVADGYHAGLFFNELQVEIAQLTTLLCENPINFLSSMR